MSRLLGIVAALGAVFALSGSAIAGDDTMRLDMKKSASVTLTGGAAGQGQFTHDARAKPTEDDVEDVFFGYRRGFNRGFSGYGYFGPRFYPFRAGYGAGYFASSFYYPSYYGFYRPYYYPSYYGFYRPYYYPSYYYSAPVAYYYPCGGVSATV